MYCSTKAKVLCKLVHVHAYACTWYMPIDKFIIAIHVDNENTGLQTSIVVDKNIYIDPSEYIIQGIMFNFKISHNYFL